MMKSAFRCFQTVLLLCGASGAETDKVSVMEGDSVTLNTGVKTNQQSRIIWYYNNSRIAQITRDQRKICTDDWCEERFRDRLQLDQTGSLTITDTRTTDSGLYHLQINSRNHEKSFSVTVQGVSGVSAADVKSVKEGEAVTLDPGVINDLMTWYYNDVCIAEITGDQRKSCTDERFRDRLQLDPQTGSLTITDSRTTDSGLYQLQINSSSSSSFSVRRTRSFSVSVTGSGWSSAAAAGVCAAGVTLLVTAASAVNYYRKHRKSRTATPNNETDPVKYFSVSQTEAAANGASQKKTETPP